MSPLLSSGDSVGVQWFSPDETQSSCQKGDILVCRNSEGTWVLHRLLSKLENGSCLVKGDSSFVVESFGVNQIWGRMVAYQRRGRERHWRLSLLDKWVAHFSFSALSDNRLKAAFFRRLARGMAWLRKQIP